MPSNTEALCFFLARLGSKVSDGSDDGSSAQPLPPPQRHSRLAELIAEEEDAEGQPPRYRLPSLALFKTLDPGASPGPAPSSSQRRTARYDLGASAATNLELRTKKKNDGAGAASSWPRETALRHLAAPASYRASDLPRAPAETARRALDSFAFLLQANLRQFFRIQLRRHAASSGSGGGGSCEARAREIASAFFRGIAGGGGDDEGEDKPIDVVSASTSFHLDGSGAGGEPDAAGESERRIVFHMTVDLRILGAKVSVPITLAGGVKVTFERGTGKIDGLTLFLETDELLRSMRTQARLVILKAVAQRGCPVLHDDGDDASSVVTAESAGAAGAASPPLLSAETPRHSPPIVETTDAKANAKANTNDEMKKLALCASLELAAVINSSSPLASSPRTAVERRSSLAGAKRRLGAAMGAGGGLFAAVPQPPGKRIMLMPRKKGEGKIPSSLPPAMPMALPGRIVQEG